MTRAGAIGVLVAGLVAGVGIAAYMWPSQPRPVSNEREAAARRPARPATPTPGDPKRVETPPPTDRIAPRRAAEAAPTAATSATSEAVAVPTTGILHIESDVAGAQIFVDRQFAGAAPVSGYEVKPGSHRVNVSADGYEGVVETIDVTPGPRRLVIKLREVRLDAALTVIHKHRFGSCTGRLVATPQGIRYETTDKDDVFTTPLLDLDDFEVDYLKKNLKLKLKQGKTFDFTDPEGNADRLFVFHRDVDHARERLKKGDPPATK